MEQETVTVLHLDHCSVLDALDGGHFRVAVKRDAPQPEREARAVAGVLMLRQQLVHLCHQHLT